MEKTDIVNYVMETPGNTNPAVLNSLLNQLPSGSDTFEVNLTLVPSNGYANYPTGIVTLNKTYQEILAAYEAGKEIIGKLAIEISSTYPYTCIIPIQYFGSSSSGEIQDCFTGYGYGGEESFNGENYNLIIWISLYTVDGEIANDSSYEGYKH